MKIEDKEGNKDLTNHKLEDIKDQFPLQLESNIVKIDSKEIKSPLDSKNIHMNLETEMKIEMREGGHNIGIGDRVNLQEECLQGAKEDMVSKDQVMKKDIGKTEDSSKEEEETPHKDTGKTKVIRIDPKKDKGKGISGEIREIYMVKEDRRMKRYKGTEKDKTINQEGKDLRVLEASIIQK